MKLPAGRVRSRTKAALPFFESEWGRDPKRYGDACNFMQKLSAEYSLHLLNGKVCKIDARQSNFYLWISRIPPDCHKIPSLGDSCGKNRGVANGMELATELSKRYAHTTILYVNTGTIPYLDQVFLIRAASTIIAAHGGRLVECGALAERSTAPASRGDHADRRDQTLLNKLLEVLNLC